MGDTHRRTRGRRVNARVKARRVKIAAVTAVAVCVIAAVVAGCFAWRVTRHLDETSRIPLDLGPSRVADQPGTGKDGKERDLNILLLGSDSTGHTLAADARKATWPVGVHRSDTIMVLHVSRDRKHVGLLSLPRDTRVPIYDGSGNQHDVAKINAAFSFYGPAGALATVEQFTSIHLDHLVVIDWDGVRGVSNAVGGVPVTIPRSFCDHSQDVCWKAGKQTLQGDEALAYVRTRHGLPRGDFDRINRQQNFLRAMASKAAAEGSLTRPRQLDFLVETIASHITVDDGFTTRAMLGLANSLRGIDLDKASFMTPPIAGTPTVPVLGSVVDLQQEGAVAMFEAFARDRVEQYVKAHPDVVAPDVDDVR